VSFVLRAPAPTDGLALWRLAEAAGLDVNSPYAYVLWGEYHATTSVVATTADGSLQGYVTGFTVPARPDTAFVWQVAVAATARRQGLGARMLDAVVARCGATWVEATVTPSNTASDALFRGLGDRHGADVVVTELFDASLFPPGHEPEVLYRIGPLPTVTPADPRT
jgi:L-2,4-diaminobutyric acid acetyltransferase